MTAEGRTADAHIHADIDHGAAQHGDQFALRSWILDVQSAQHTPRRARKIVLHEMRRQPMFCVAIGLIDFGEESPAVPEYLGLDDQNAGNFSLENVH